MFITIHIQPPRCTTTLHNLHTAVSTLIVIPSVVSAGFGWPYFFIIKHTVAHRSHQPKKKNNAKGMAVYWVPEHLPIHDMFEPHPETTNPNDLERSDSPRNMRSESQDCFWYDLVKKQRETILMNPCNPGVSFMPQRGTPAQEMQDT